MVLLTNGAGACGKNTPDHSARACADEHSDDVADNGDRIADQHTVDR